jgi:hypothetical protein
MFWRTAIRISSIKPGAFYIPPDPIERLIFAGKASGLHPIFETEYKRKIPKEVLIMTTPEQDNLEPPVVLVTPENITETFGREPIHPQNVEIFKLTDKLWEELKQKLSEVYPETGFVKVKEPEKVSEEIENGNL